MILKAFSTCQLGKRLRKTRRLHVCVLHRALHAKRHHQNVEQSAVLCWYPVQWQQGYPWHPCTLPPGCCASSKNMTPNGCSHMYFLNIYISVWGHFHIRACSETDREQHGFQTKFSPKEPGHPKHSCGGDLQPPVRAQLQRALPSVAGKRCFSCCS